LFTLQRGWAFGTLKREQHTFPSLREVIGSFRVVGVFRGSNSGRGSAWGWAFGTLKREQRTFSSQQKALR
jgi:hypothetical protein